MRKMTDHPANEKYTSSEFYHGRSLIADEPASVDLPAHIPRCLYDSGGKASKYSNKTPAGHFYDLFKVKASFDEIDRSLSSYTEEPKIIPYKVNPKLVKDMDSLIT